MPQTPLTRRQGALLVKVIISGMLVQLAVIFYVGYSSYTGRQTVVNSQRKGCERGKRDRKANADFQVAHTKYIERLVLAKSVPPDVRRSASEAVRTYKRTSADLTKRAKIDCSTVYPKVRLLP